MNKITLSLSLNEARIIHNGASQERKLELEELFPELKPQPITDRVKDYEDALEVLKRDHFDEKNLYPREIARRMLETIIEALNEGWKPNFNDSNQNKWYCCFYRAASGLGCTYSTTSPSYALTYIDVRFCLKSKEIADYLGHQFLYLYKKMLLG